jgi:hypothetical protein
MLNCSSSTCNTNNQAQRTPACQVTYRDKYAAHKFTTSTMYVSVFLLDRINIIRVKKDTYGFKCRLCIFGSDGGRKETGFLNVSFRSLSLSSVWGEMRGGGRLLTVIFIHCSVRPTDRATAHDYALPIMPRLPPTGGKQCIQSSSFIQTASETISFSWGYAKPFPMAPLVRLFKGTVSCDRFKKMCSLFRPWADHACPKKPFPSRDSPFKGLTKACLSSSNMYVFFKWWTVNERK